jgi:glyoxylase-like metal-dependent hydrolase (beta-lactamase superfamily II)
VKQVADGVWQLRGFPPDAINSYLVEDVLIDAGTRHAAKRIFRQLKGRTVTAHALTHAHPDHQGSSDEVCGKLGIPFWVGEKDVPYAEEPARITETGPGHPYTSLGMKFMVGPGRNVDRVLREGDEVAGFTVLDVPGHSRGHVAFWRERDGVLILGDVINNIDIVTGIPGLHEPPLFVAFDAEENRRSARRLAALDPKVILFGHGRPLADSRKFTSFVAGLPNP